MLVLREDGGNCSMNEMVEYEGGKTRQHLQEVD